MQEIIDQLIESQNRLKQKKTMVLTMKATDYDAQITEYEKAITALKKVL